MVSRRQADPITDERWITELPTTLSECADRWGLVIGERLSGGLVGHVFACRTRSDEAAVLKLNPPSATDYAGPPEQEAAALRAWAGRGAVELLEFAPDLGALLTRRAVPGTQLADGDEDEALCEVADVLANLLEASVPAIAFAPLSRAVDRYLVRKMMLGARVTGLTHLVEQARASAQELAASSDVEALLHGDLMDKNLLRDHRRLVAIDPIPRVGDPHSDIAFWAATRAPAQLLERRASALAQLLGLSPKRAARWAAVYAVGEACETWRKDSKELREWACSERARELLTS